MRFKIFFVAIFLFIFSWVSTTNAKILKIYGIQSYTINHICGYPQLEGFKQELQKLGIKYEMRVYYLRSRTVYTSPYDLKEEARYVLHFIKQWKPDVIVLFDDAAFKYMAPIIPKKYPIVFSGMNNYYENYLDEFPSLKDKKICGVEELFSLTKFNAMINYFDDVYVLYGQTPTSQYALVNFMKEYHKIVEGNYLARNKLKLKLVSIVSLQDLNSVLDKINASNKKILVVITVQRVLNRYDMTYMKSIDVLKYVESHVTNQITLFFNLNAVKFTDLAIGPNFYEMGSLAADVMLRCLRDNYKQVVTAMTYIWVSRGNLYKHHRQDFLEQYLEKFDEIKP